MPHPRPLLALLLAASPLGTPDPAEAAAPPPAPRPAPPPAELVAPAGLDRLVAATATLAPRLDGALTEAEWAEASHYTLDQGSATLDLYLAVTALRPAPGDPGVDCILYPENPAYRIPCGDYLWVGARAGALSSLKVYLDEGDDGAHGSGSGDGVLTDVQEDAKEVNFGQLTNLYCDTAFGKVEGCPAPACVPWSGEACWQCVPSFEGSTSGESCQWSGDTQVTTPAIGGPKTQSLDGYYMGPGAVEGFTFAGSGSAAHLADFGYLAYGDLAATQWELLLPFRGLEEGDGAVGYDRSDARFTHGDVLNLLLYTPSGPYPRGGDRSDVSTWIPLQIGGPREVVAEGAGCAGATAPGGWAALLLAPVVGLAGRRRRVGGRRG